MKLETATLLKAHLDNSKFEIEAKEKQLEFKHNFSDEEILELVETEYGTSIVQPVPDLFRAIVRDLLRMGLEFAKEKKVIALLAFGLTWINYGFTPAFILLVCLFHIELTTGARNEKSK